MTENNIPTSEVLNRAADLIQERGHTTGVGWNWEQGGPLCLEGGIAAAAGLQFDDAWGCPAYEAVVEYLADKTSRAPFIWNDRLRFVHDENDENTYRYVGGSEATGRAYAAEQVIATLRAAAAIEQAREPDVAPLATTQREVSA